MSLAPRVAREIMRHVRRQRPGMSRAYIDDLKLCLCVRCGRPGPNDPHHLQRSVPVGERGTGRRASDQFAIPLCRRCHRWVESTGDDEAQLASIGIDGRALAAASWRERGRPEAMQRIAVRFHQASLVYCNRMVAVQ